MTKQILRETAIIMLALFVNSIHSHAQNQIPNLVKSIAPSTVLILTYDSERKELSQGSGFFYEGWNEIITNQHVLEGASFASIKTSDGRLFDLLHVVGENKSSDLVLLQAGMDSSVARPLPITKTLPKVGESVVAIGAPFGLATTVTSGIVSGIREMPRIWSNHSDFCFDIKWFKRQSSGKSQRRGGGHSDLCFFKRPEPQFCCIIQEPSQS